MKGVLIICLIVCLISLIRAQKNPKGPYKTTMTSLTNCAKTSLPLLTRNPGFVYNLGLVNTTKKTNLLIGNITVTRSLKNLSGIVVAYKWEMGEWRTHFTLPRLSCQSPVSVTIIAMMTNIKFDTVQCVVLKGTYQLEFDMNVADHIWAQEREYGRMRWKLEFVTNSNTIACFYAENVVEPIKQVNGTKAT